MSTVFVEQHDRIALVRMNRGVINALNTDLVTDLHKVVMDAPQSFDGLVLAGGTKFFSMGLDLPELLLFSREDMDRFWDLFDDMILTLYSVPIPTASAISGHAIAGGTILSLACDYRVIAEGRKLLGLNEINIGLPVPYLADLILRQIVSDAHANRIVFRGELLETQQAAELGLVDEVAPLETVESRAIEHVTDLGHRSQPAFALIKAHRTEDLQMNFIAQRQRKKEQLLQCWFQPRVQNLLRAAAEKF